MTVYSYTGLFVHSWCCNSTQLATLRRHESRRRAYRQVCAVRQIGALIPKCIQIHQSRASGLERAKYAENTLETLADEREHGADEG